MLPFLAACFFFYSQTANFYYQMLRNTSKSNVADMHIIGQKLTIIFVCLSYGSLGNKSAHILNKQTICVCLMFLLIIIFLPVIYFYFFENIKKKICWQINFVVAVVFDVVLWLVLCCIFQCCCYILHHTC